MAAIATIEVDREEISIGKRIIYKDQWLVPYNKCEYGKWGIGDCPVGKINRELYTLEVIS